MCDVNLLIAVNIGKLDSDLDNHAVLAKIFAIFAETRTQWQLATKLDLYHKG